MSTQERQQLRKRLEKAQQEIYAEAPTEGAPELVDGVLTDEDLLTEAEQLIVNAPRSGSKEASRTMCQLSLACSQLVIARQSMKPITQKM